LGIYQQIKTIEGDEHGQHRVALPVGMRETEKEWKRKRVEGERGGSWGKKTAEEAFLEPIITYEG
jgi:hypothetical protein